MRAPPKKERCLVGNTRFRFCIGFDFEIRSYHIIHIIEELFECFIQIN